MSEFYASSISSILNQFNTDLNQGLSIEASHKARAQHGKNEFDSDASTLEVGELLKRMFSWQVIVLALAVAALIVPFSVQNNDVPVQSIGVIGAILLLHIVWTCITEFRIHRCTKQIQEHLTFNIQVIRQGKREQCTPQDIVPGDLISFSTGDYIPADARIVSASELMIDESALFGTDGVMQKTSDDIESNPRVDTEKASRDKEKTAARLPPEKQTNMVFGGTYVEAGKGEAIVVRTGKRTEFWKNRRNVTTFTAVRTFAESEINSLHDVLKVTGIVMAALAVAIAWWFGYQSSTGQLPSTDWQMLLNLGVLFILASAPQDAVTLLRLTFAQHAKKLLKKGVALRNPRHIEKLSRITTFCANENGLSTTGSLSLSSMFVDEQIVESSKWKAWLRSLQNLSDEQKKKAVNEMPPDSAIPPGSAGLVLAAALATSVLPDENSNGADSSVQQAIKKDIRNLGYRLQELQTDFPLINEYPCTPSFGYQMAVFETGTQSYHNIIFGDAEKVLDTCAFALIEGEITDLQEDQYYQYRDVIKYLRSTKIQVYGVASQISEVTLTPPEVDASTFLGFIAFSRTKDEETKTVVKSSLETGLKIILITDSNEQRTVDVAKELGLIHTRKAVASGEALEPLTREQLDERTSQCLAYSNPSREQRRDIVVSLKSHGHFVGFLGQDGTDLRAMSAADIAFANGNDASHLVQIHSDGLIYKRGFRALRDSLLHAREAYRNLASSVRWGVSCTLSLLLTLVFGTILSYTYKLPMPLTLVQVAWVQFLVSVLLALGAGCEHIFLNERQHRPVMFSRSRFFSKTAGLDIICRALTISLIALIPFFLMLWRSDLTDSDIAVARTSVCTTLIFTQLASCWQALRYPWESLFQRIFANTRLFIVFFVVIGLHLTALYVEPITQFLELAPLGWEWQWTLLFSLGLFLLPLNLAINSRPEFD